jgi:microcystin-dependent protein
MASGPNVKTSFEKLFEDTRTRVTLLERRMATGGGGGAPYDAEPGMVMPFSGTVVPEGWLLADGTAVSRTAYSKLFDVIGTTYGPGDGSTTFNLPNYKGRVLVGQDAAQTEFDVLGETGGAKAVTLTINEMPSHSHQWNAAGTNNPGGTPANWDDIVGANTAALGVGPSNPEDTSNSIKPRGGGAAHNNLQPYAVAQYIISTGDGVGGGTARASTGEGGATPAGVITPFAGATNVVPAGYLLCDGAAVSRTAFAALFAAIGTAWGVGDGTTTFNLPNLKGRTTFGLDSTQAEFDVLGETGGAKTHRHDFRFGLFDRNWMPAGSNAGMLATTEANDNDRMGAYRYSTGKYSGATQGSPSQSTSNLSSNAANGTSVTSSLLNRMETVGDTATPTGTTGLPPYAVANYIISTGAGSSSGVPAVLPVDLWQEFSLIDTGGLRPVVGGAVVFDGPVKGNLGATRRADKATIDLPSAGTYRILTHLGLAGNPGAGTSAQLYLNNVGYSPSVDYGNAGAAGVYVSHIETVITTTGPTFFTQGASAPLGMYSWTWLRVEKVEPFYPKSPVLAVTQGSTAQRDSIYGVPATDAERASLANRRITWFNTDYGWEESYFAVTGAVGLTVRGLETGVAAGWYPLANGPRGIVFASGGQAHTSGSQFTAWRDFGTGGSWRNVPGTIMHKATNNAALQTYMAGRYKATCRMDFPVGTGTGVCAFHFVDSNTNGTDFQSQYPVTLQASYGNTLTYDLGERLMYSSGYIFFNTVSASWTLGIAGGSYMQLEYTGPPLVSDPNGGV